MSVETVAKFPIRIEPTPQSRISELDYDNIPFGHIFSDHMFVADYDNGEWNECRIEPFGNFNTHPATSAIHYGQSIFEGMKGYYGEDGRAILFRPDRNIARFNISARRMGMPDVPPELFEDALKKLVDLDRKWIPPTEGSSLYIRPFMYATEEFIGLKPAEKFRFAILTCPVGVYYAKPVKVLVSTEYVRAFPGGTGYAKAAGNYGATMQPLIEARAKGYDQLLWLDGKEFSKIQEIGTMNVFFLVGDKVITPSTDEGTILDGVTRDSVMQLCRDKGYTVEERDFTMAELKAASADGSLKEVFGTGTAATIAMIEEIGFDGGSIKLDTTTYDLANWVKAEITAIRTGKTADRHSWNVYV